jgi:threonine dehydratase
MWPWEADAAEAGTGEPSTAVAAASIADGILDDETYDWLGVFEALSGTGGSPVVVAEAQVERALALARLTTREGVSATGTAGLAGLLAIRDQIDDGERVAVIFSGIER